MRKNKQQKDEGTGRKYHPILIELPPKDYERLVKILNAGKYATKIDFFRTKVREEKI